MNLWHAWSADYGICLGWTVVHSIWQGTLIAAALAAVLPMLRGRSAQARYVASLIALATVLACAAMTFVLSTDHQAVRSDTATTPMRLDEASLNKSRQSLTPTEQLGKGSQPPPTVANRTFSPRTANALQPALPTIAGLWIAGVLALCCWNLGGWVAAQRLRVIGICLPDESINAMVKDLRGRIGIERPVRVLISLLAQTPMVIGWLRPVLLLPAALASGLTSKQMESLFAHELAHIRRHDYLINLLQVLAETLLFYHPAVWWISRQIRIAREDCCDDIAVANCGDRCAYAESLAAVEEARIGASVALAAIGSGGSQLLRRIRRILGFSEDGRQRSLRGVAAAAVWLAIAFVAIVGLRRGSLAATTPATQAAPLPRTLPAAPKAAVVLVTDGNYFLEKALAASSAEGVSILTIKPAEFEGYRKNNDTGRVVIFDRWAPMVAPSAPTLYFGVVPPDSHLADRDGQGHTVHIRDADVVDWNHEHPTLRELDLSKLYVGEGLKLRAADDWKTLARAKDGPLILAHNDGDRRIVIGFDLMQSNWPFQVSFPMFIHRSLQWLNGGGPAAGAIPASLGAEPQTRPTTSLQADCVLSGLVEGKREVLASPRLNLENDIQTGFLFTGKPPVIIERNAGQEKGIFGTIRARNLPGASLRVGCSLSRRTGQAAQPGTNDADLSGRLSIVTALQADLDKARRLYGAALDAERRRKAGEERPYTDEEIARVSTGFAAKVAKENDALFMYQQSLSNYGSNYPTTISAQRALSWWQDSVKDARDKFNQHFLIEDLEGVPRAIPSDPAQLRGVVDQLSRELERETEGIKGFGLNGTVHTDQLVKPGEPIGVELEDGTRLEVRVHPAD